MRQETGSKTLTINNTVSIQLKLGGHFFSASTISNYIENRNYKTIEFIVSTPKTTFVPREQFETALMGRYLELNGIACSALEIAIEIPISDDIIAVCAINKKCYDGINARLGTRAIFKTPFSLTDSDGQRRTEGIYIVTIEGLLHIMIFSSGNLIFAEPIMAKNQADYIYIMERISKEFSKQTYLLHLSGDYTKDVIKILKLYSKRVICE